MILRVQNAVWIIGWVACLIAFISVFFPSWKLFLSNLGTSSTPSLSIELFNWFLSQSRYLPIARWIDREISCPFDSSSTHRACFAVNTWTLSTATSVETFKAGHLSRYLLTPISVEIYWGFIYRFIRDPDFIFLISLDLFVAVHLPNIHFSL